jgi:hypothetical protein
MSISHLFLLRVFNIRFDLWSHLEEQITSLKKELDEVKSQGGKRGEREDGLQRQVQVYYTSYILVVSEDRQARALSFK